MDPITQQTVTAAAGAAGGGDPVYVDDVFSTFVYGGNNTTLPINNGIDLAGEGGLVWIKKRNGTNVHGLYDTLRGVQKPLNSAATTAETTETAGLTAFNANGFTLSGSGDTNQTTGDYASWTFRKAPGFFDVVTYTGNGANRTIAHNLGSVPGMILIKCTSHAASWTVYHRSIGATKHLTLDNYFAEFTSAYKFNNTEPTSSVFTIGVGGNSVNTLGYTYVAYIFAHDEPVFGTDEDESIIKCGIYTVSASGAFDVDLGFEPQFVLVKSSTSSNQYAGWYLFDNMRGSLDSDNKSTANLIAEDVTSESSNGYDQAAYDLLQPLPTGFRVAGGASGATAVAGGGESYIYMAIRRPHKPPEVATDVFAIDYGNGSSTIPAFDSGFPVDFAIAKVYGSNDSNETITRLTGTKALKTDTPAAEVDNGANWVTDSNAGWGKVDYTSTRISWMFKRAPGFFDVVAYSYASGSPRNVNHNLGVTPEMMIVKIRNGQGEPWAVYHSSLGATKGLALNLSDAASTSSTFGGGSAVSAWWNSTAPTSSVFTVGGAVSTNWAGQTYIAYLFATLPGISKVGSYTGNGATATIDVDCGFTSGARFVLIKQTNNTGDWYLWDTTRGINSGNEPYLRLNYPNIQLNEDFIDPLNAGFTISNTNSPLNQVNISGASYIFLAIA